MPSWSWMERSWRSSHARVSCASHTDKPCSLSAERREETVTCETSGNIQYDTYGGTDHYRELPVVRRLPHRRLVAPRETAIDSQGGTSRQASRRHGRRTHVPRPFDTRGGNARADAQQLYLVLANGSWQATVRARVALRGFVPRRGTGVVLSHSDPDGDPFVAVREDLVPGLVGRDRGP